jgi:hypothetical protein
VIEVVSNDGYLPIILREDPVLGIEPAENVARRARERVLTVMSSSAELAHRLRATASGQMSYMHTTSSAMSPT